MSIHEPARTASRPLTLGDLSEATKGSLSGAPTDRVVEGRFRTDNREVQPGDVFVALQGESFDGHDFVNAASSLGAVASVVRRGHVAAAEGTLIQVDDTLEAVGRLASLWLGRLHATVVGVTGSAGKTSTKDMLGFVLAEAGETVVPAGSLNNEVGVPQTAFQATETTRFVVAEMGARGVGHIRYLCDLVHPAIGVVLNVGHAHIGEFGGRDAIALAKGELVESLPADGVAVLNADDPLVAAMAVRSKARVLTFGRRAGADVRAEDVGLDASGRAAFRLTAAGESVSVELQFAGEHMVSNALASAAVGIAVGIPLDRIAAALDSARPEARWRMELTERPDGVTVINDAYNANPDSMAAALDALAHIGSGRRRIAVLGEMLELGSESAAAHRDVGRLAVEQGSALLVVVGAGAAEVGAGATTAGARLVEPGDIEALLTGARRSPGTVAVAVPDREAAAGLLGEVLRPGDVVLVKSSRDAGLRWLGDDLAAGAVDEPE